MRGSAPAQHQRVERPLLKRYLAASDVNHWPIIDRPCLSVSSGSAEPTTIASGTVQRQFLEPSSASAYLFPVRHCRERPLDVLEHCERRVDAGLQVGLTHFRRRSTCVPPRS